MTRLIPLLLILQLPPLSLSIFHHTWGVVLVPSADPFKVASQLRMVNLGPIGSLPGHYRFQHRGYPRHSYYHASEITHQVISHRKVKEATQQTLLSRKKRTFENPYITNKSGSEKPIKDQITSFSDPMFHKQWYLFKEYNNVTGAWLQGATGSGIIVTILDDGLEWDHKDLQTNYEPKASEDLNSDESDHDPMPKYDASNMNKHGTRCAGEVAAVAGNNECGIGAAFHAKIGGIRMLDGDVTDAVEAAALGFQPKYIDIYSVSWGPDDDGKKFDGPGTLATRSFETGVKEGRNGLGSIYVWASGNGGTAEDNCNCDGYTNSMYTLSIGSVSEKGTKPWYAETCSSTLAVTYSSGSGREKQIVTTDLRDKCTENHTGTSASAPLAAGIFALALQAHPEMGWRDLQHMVVRSSRVVGENNDKDRGVNWVTNGAGFPVSHEFGFGVINGGELVSLARIWNNVPEKFECKDDWKEVEDEVAPGTTSSFKVVTDGCALPERVAHLEHVQAEITIETERRGDVHITLTSPSQTISQLLTTRKADNFRGETTWPFLTVHSWGEDPSGTWVLSVTNTGAYPITVHRWRLILHGTATLPELRDSSREIDSTANITRTMITRESSNSEVKMIAEIFLVFVYPFLVVLYSMRVLGNDL